MPARVRKQWIGRPPERRPPRREPKRLEHVPGHCRSDPRRMEQQCALERERQLRWVELRILRVGERKLLVERRIKSGPQLGFSLLIPLIRNFYTGHTSSLGQVELAQFQKAALRFGKFLCPQNWVVALQRPVNRGRDDLLRL